MHEGNRQQRTGKDYLAIERFNQQLDVLLAGQAPQMNELDGADRRALELAERLGQADFSRQSLSYFRVRKELLQGARRKPEGRATAPLATRSLCLLAVIVLAGWTIASLVRPLAQVNAPRATAYRLPAGLSTTSLVSSTSPYDLTGQGQALSPQPAPTPHAPVEVVSAAPPGYHAPPVSLSASPTQSMTRSPQGTNP